MSDTKIVLHAEIPSMALHWRNDIRIRMWCRQYSLIDAQSHQRWLERITTDPTIKMFGLVADIPPDVPMTYGGWCGVAGLTSIDRVNQSAEFSLYISPGHQRLGYGKMALLELLRHGFNDFNLNRIWGESFADNPALKMFDSIGMQREGCLRQAYFRNGKWVDAIRVSMLREEFQCSTSASS